jgi:hypothetical protein
MISLRLLLFETREHIPPAVIDIIISEPFAFLVTRMEQDKKVALEFEPTYLVSTFLKDSWI